MPVSIVPPSQREELDVVGDHVCPLLEADQFEMFELSGPRDSGPPPHAHPWDEGYFVTDGEVLIGSDGGEVTVGPGHRVLVPAGTTHWYRILSDSARLIVVTGGAKAASFFRDMHASTPAGPPTEATMPVIIEVAKRNGLTSPLF